MKYTLVFLLLSLVNCQTKNTESINSYDSVKHSSSEEKFEEFFYKFKTDSLFQIDRVKFPLPIESWDIDENNLMMEEILRNDWRHLNFEYKEEYATRSVDAYKQEIRIFTDSAKIELRGIDNGIHVDYLFHYLSEQWYLVLERDYSD